MTKPIVDYSDVLQNLYFTNHIICINSEENTGMNIRIQGYPDNLMVK